MDQFIILLDQHIYYSPARSSKLFSKLKMTGHLEAAREFKKNYPHAKIIRQNYLANLDKYLKDTNSNEHIYLIYCGHGSPYRWNIGISKKKLEKSLQLVSNKITIISDCCYSDTMDVSMIRKNVSFVSAARASGSINDTSAFFTFDGGYLTNIFYHCFRPKLSFQQLKKRILKYYFDDFGENLHRPRFFN